MYKNCDFIQNINDELWLTEKEGENLTLSYRLKEIIYEENSPIQHILIVDSYDFGRMLVLDGIVQTTEKDGFVYNEMICHIPLSLHPNAKNVLIIGGGDCGVLNELSKYPSLNEIHMVEIDKSVVEASLKYLKGVSGGKIHKKATLFFEDGIKFIQDKKGYYDVIIIDSSDPLGQAEALFEKDFYKSVYEALKPDGIMSCQSESPIYYSDVLKNSYNSIKELFPLVKLYSATIPTYPGSFWTFTIGSKKYNTVARDDFSLDTKYVNKNIINTCFNNAEFIENLINS